MAAKIAKAEMQVQRDELLNALKSARRVMTDNGIRLMVGDTDVISAAIEKASGGK